MLHFYTALPMLLVFKITLSFLEKKFDQVNNC